MPKKGRWTLIDQKQGIWFLQSTETFDPCGKDGRNGGNNSQQVYTKTVFYIKAYGPRASVVVNDFINAAFDWYKELKRGEEDMARYFLMAVPPEDKANGDGAKGGKAYLFKQHLLTSLKTFRSLF